MKRNIIKVQPFLVLIILMAFGCTHDPAEMPGPGGGIDPCDTLNITYQSTVFPILQQYCMSCHGVAITEAGLNFENYNDVAFVAQSGQLLGSIKHEPNYSPMPQGLAQLGDCEIAKIEIWIRDTTFTNPPGENPCNPDTVYFQNTILPLLQSSCGIIGCHDPGTATERIILTDYQNIMNSNIITPGNPGESELYEIISENDPDKIMPPPSNTPLTSQQKATVFTWIQQGALNNYCEQQECDTVNVTFSQTIWPIVQGSCFGCHSGSSPQGGINLDNYQSIVEVVGTGKLMGSIKHESGFSPMPQNGSKLSDCKLSQIQKWIDNGTPNN